MSVLALVCLACLLVFGFVQQYEEHRDAVCKLNKQTQKAPEM